MTTTEDNVVLLWGDRGGVEWGIGDVGLHDFEGGGVDDLGAAVLGSGDAVCAVCGPLEIGDLLAGLVDLCVVDLLSGLAELSVQSLENESLVLVLPVHRTGKRIHPRVLQ